MLLSLTKRNLGMLLFPSLLCKGHLRDFKLSGGSLLRRATTKPRKKMTRKLPLRNTNLKTGLCQCLASLEELSRPLEELLANMKTVEFLRWSFAFIMAITLKMTKEPYCLLIETTGSKLLTLS
jgi:hypothetical protein